MILEKYKFNYIDIIPIIQIFSLIFIEYRKNNMFFVCFLILIIISNLCLAVSLIREKRNVRVYQIFYGILTAVCCSLFIVRMFMSRKIDFYEVFTIVVLYLYIKKLHDYLKKRS